MTPPKTMPLLRVGFCDVGVVLTTRGGAQVIVQAHDATDLADALWDAVEAFHAHHPAHAG